MPIVRMCKFDPALRHPNGAFGGDDWTSISDVGKPFGGVELTLEEYLRVEQVHLDVVRELLAAAGVQSLHVEEVEYHGPGEAPMQEGQVVGLDAIPEVLRPVLREEAWCRLEGPGAFVHVGYDYYLWIGVPTFNEALRDSARARGIFLEDAEDPWGGVA